MASLVSGMSRLNPFNKSTREDDDEDQGEEVEAGTIAGGGHSARQTAITRSQLRVSPALKSFLVNQNVLSSQDAGISSDGMSQVLTDLVSAPHIEVPAALTDRSHPIQDYFISSSHNTYLTAHQLYGTSNAAAYEAHLVAGARCVEIDAWDNETDKEEPKVTHGYTLVSHVPFRAVCETIRDVVDREAAESINAQGHKAAPILISLENHCGAQGQLRMVEIMKAVWGDRLLSKRVRDEGTRDQEGSADHVILSDLGSKICLIVEFHYAGEKVEQELEEVEEEKDDEKRAREEYELQKKDAAVLTIIPELADLGVYAQSVKPSDLSWFEAASLTNGPHDPLVNLSETGLVQHMPKENARIALGNTNHLMRVYPKGTRISSANLKPVPFWNIGAQICALNWQTFGASMQLNEALFSGTDGYVLKPAALRAGGGGKLTTDRKKKLHLQIAGATDVPVPHGRQADDIKPYISCTLVHPDDLQGNPPKRKTKPYKVSKVKEMVHGAGAPVTEPIWDDTLEWEYDDNELTFLRILLKSDDSFAKNPIFAVAAVRLSYVVTGWRFIRMLDLKGRETKCSILVNFQIDDL